MSKLKAKGIPTFYQKMDSDNAINYFYFMIPIIFLFLCFTFVRWREDKEPFQLWNLVEY